MTSTELPPLARMSASVATFTKLVARHGATQNTAASLAVVKTALGWLRTARDLERTGSLNDEQAALFDDAMKKLSAFVLLGSFAEPKGTEFVC